MNETTKRALSQAAEDGDLDAVRAFFTLPSGAEAIARSNADHRLAREMAVAANTPPPQLHFESRHAHDYWYLYFPPKEIWERETIFKRIIKYRQFHVLEWFISRDACAVVGDTMCGLIYSVLTTAVASAKQSDAETVLEMILESDLCMEVLPPAELKFALEHLAGQAIRKKRADLLRLAVAYGVDVNSHYDGNSLLFYAAHCGHAESIRELARSGVFGVQYMYPISINNNDAALSLIELGLDLQGVPGFEYSSLQKAMLGRDLELAELLLTHGYPDVNARGLTANSALILAVDSKNYSPISMDIVPLLLSYGADVRHRGVDGRTAIHAAARFFVETKALAYLLAHDPDSINIPDDKGRTPLHVFLTSSSTSFSFADADLLLSYGADPYVNDHEGESAYDELMRSKTWRAYMKSRPQYFPPQGNDESGTGENKST